MEERHFTMHTESAPDTEQYTVKVGYDANF